MEIEDRIKKIISYFKMFNITANSDKQEMVAFALIEFPDKWIVNSSVIDDNRVGIKKKDKGYYFIVDINAYDISVLFDAVDKVVDYNKEMAERIELYNAKVAELKSMFANESIESLRHFKFTKEEEDLLPIGLPSVVDAPTAAEVAAEVAEESKSNKKKKKEDNATKADKPLNGTLMGLAEEIVEAQ